MAAYSEKLQFISSNITPILVVQLKAFETLHFFNPE